VRHMRNIPGRVNGALALAGSTRLRRTRTLEPRRHLVGTIVVDELSVIRRAAAIEGDARSPRPPSEEGVQHELLTALRCEAEGG